MTRHLTTWALLLGVVSATRAGDWPAWRGPTGDGHAAEENLPLRWGPNENVLWKVPLPDEGNSTPIIWRNRVFVTQAIGKGANSRRMLMCFNRTDGKLLWQQGTVYKDKEATHGTNPYCSASPVTDGERVVVSFGSAGLYCYDFAGKELWKKDLGKLDHIWGNASSPILYDDLAILWCGPGDRQFLLAVNKKTGETVWEHDEPGGLSGGDGKTWTGSWSTPIIHRVDDHGELILSVANRVKGFDPKTGKELWSCDGLGKLVYTSPLAAKGVIVAMSGYGGPAVAVRTGGKGDITKTHVLWGQKRPCPQRIGTGAILGDNLYMLNENGDAKCWELKTGKEIGQLKERASKTNTWSSLVLAGGRFYINNHGGDTVVLSADPKLEILATNRLGERTLSSVAVSDGQLFVRTYKNLWCIGATK